MRVLRLIRREVAKWFGLDEMHSGDAIMMILMGTFLVGMIWFLIALIMEVYA